MTLEAEAEGRSYLQNQSPWKSGFLERVQAFLFGAFAVSLVLGIVVAGVLRLLGAGALVTALGLVLTPVCLALPFALVGAYAEYRRRRGS